MKVESANRFSPVFIYRSKGNKYYHMTTPPSQIPDSWKYWQSLNWPFGPKPSVKNKFNWNLNLVVAPRSLLCHHKDHTCVYQGALLSSCLRYLNKAVSLEIYKNCNWQRASPEPATCTAHIEGCWQSQERYCMQYVIMHSGQKYHCRIFNLAVSTPTAKPPNLIPRQIFQLYGITAVITKHLMCCLPKHFS